MLDVARRGDVAAYLDAFGGSAPSRLEREADERGRDAFAARPPPRRQARKSHAIFAPEPDGDAPDSARITVESTFADRIERQTYRLVRVDNGWLITDVETARDHVPARPSARWRPTRSPRESRCPRIRRPATSTGSRSEIQEE